MNRKKRSKKNKKEKKFGRIDNKYNKEESIKRIILIKMIVGTMLISGCASTSTNSETSTNKLTNSSLLMGLGLGAATGAMVGATTKRNRKKWILHGLFIGATIGGTSSYIIHNSLKSRDEAVRKETLFELEKFSSLLSTEKEPSENGVHDFLVAPPGISKECFDWEIRNKKLVEGHCVWIIDRDSSWVPPSEGSFQGPQGPHGSMKKPRQRSRNKRSKGDRR